MMARLHPLDLRALVAASIAGDSNIVGSNWRKETIEHADRLLAKLERTAPKEAEAPESTSLLKIFERLESAEFFCRHFKEDRDRALLERDAARAKGAEEERDWLCRLFTTGQFVIRQFVPSSVETVSLTTETALRVANSMEPLP